jgi:hypothetical protein
VNDLSLHDFLFFNGLMNLFVPIAIGVLWFAPSAKAKAAAPAALGYEPEGVPPQGYDNRFGAGMPLACQHF